jgi:hypothetical protein
VELCCAYDSPVPRRSPRTICQKAHLLEKEQVQEEALLSFPRHTRLPTTKSISREPLYQDLSSTVPTSLHSLPASSRSSFLRHHHLDIIQPPANFSARPIAEPIPRSPSSIIHARLRSKPDLRRLVRLTGSHRLGSPTLSCKSRCTSQAQSTNQLPTAAIACCNSLATPAFFFDSLLQKCCRHLALPQDNQALKTNGLPPSRFGETHPICHARFCRHHSRHHLKLYIRSADPRA